MRREVCQRQLSFLWNNGNRQRERILYSHQEHWRTRAAAAAAAVVAAADAGSWDQ